MGKDRSTIWNCVRDGKMGAAVPVSHEFMNTLVENYSVEMNGMPYGQIPPGLLWCDTRRGHEKYVWYNPPGRRRMYFTKGLNIENGECNLPGIIYVVERGGLNVFAFKGEGPGMDDRLCKAPYFNVNATSGSVCLGNASLQIPEAGILGETFLDERVLPSGRWGKPHKKQSRPRYGKSPEQSFRRKRAPTF